MVVEEVLRFPHTESANAMSRGAGHQTWNRKILKCAFHSGHRCHLLRRCRPCQTMFCHPCCFQMWMTYGCFDCYWSFEIPLMGWVMLSHNWPTLPFNFKAKKRFRLQRFVMISRCDLQFPQLRFRCLAGRIRALVREAQIFSAR